MKTGCFEKSFTWYSKCCCVASVTKEYALKDVQTIHHSSHSIQVTVLTVLLMFLIISCTHYIALALYFGVYDINNMVSDSMFSIKFCI
jgi:hypothetical protein